MSDRAAAPDRSGVIEAVALALEHAPVGIEVESDALRSALRVQSDVIFDGGALDLSEVGTLFEGRSGFDPAGIEPALCRLKIWERDLGLEVRLPPALAELSDSERVGRAARCQVPVERLAKALRGGGRSRRETSSQSRLRKTEPGPREPGRRPANAKRGARKAPPAADRRRLALVLTTFLALGALTIAGVMLWHGLSPAVSFEPLRANLGEIPVENLERRGTEAGATLTDEGWIDLSPESRRAQMKQALKNLEPAGIKVFFVRDPGGAIRATAQWYRAAGQRRIAVKFR